MTARTRSAALARVVFAAVWARAGVVAGVALALGIAAARAQPDTAQDPVDTRVFWLQAALFLLSAFVVARGVESWPGFGRDRSDGLWTRRLRIGRLGGCGAASLTTLAVLGPYAVAVAISFDLMARPGRGDGLIERTALRAVAGDRLDATQGRIEVRAPAPVAAGRIVLRPLLVLTREADPGDLDFDVEIDGVRRADGPFHFDLSTRVLVLEVHGSVERVALVWRSGGMALEWPDGTVQVRSAIAIPRWVAAGGVGLAALVDAGLALAIAILARRALATPILQLGALGTLLLWNLSGNAVVAAAVAAHARDVFFLDGPTCAALATTGLTGGLVVAAAAVAATLHKT